MKLNRDQKLIFKVRKQTAKKFNRVASLLHELMGEDTSPLFQGVVLKTLKELKFAREVINDHYQDAIEEAKEVLS